MTVSAPNWNVTFVDGTYHYVCDVHSTTMKGSFTVGNVPVATPKLKGKAEGKAISDEVKAQLAKL